MPKGIPGAVTTVACEEVDKVERIAIARAKEIFGADHANVQPHSGAQANAAVYFALVKPGDTVMGMSLAHGGHLTHGALLTFPARSIILCHTVWMMRRKKSITIRFYELAQQTKPKMIIAGASRIRVRSALISFRKLRSLSVRICLSIWHILRDW